MIRRQEIDKIGCKLGAFCTQFAPEICPTRHPYMWFQPSLRREDQRHHRGLCILFGRCDGLRVDIQG